MLYLWDIKYSRIKKFDIKSRVSRLNREIIFKYKFLEMEKRSCNLDI